MNPSFLRIVSAAVIAVPLALASPLASAQDRGGGSNGNFLDNIFKRGDDNQPPPQQPREAQGADTEMSGRIGRIEDALRQLTGTIEQLQYKNQQLEAQLKRMQDDSEYRFQQLGSRGGPAPNQPAPRTLPPQPQQGQAPVNAPPVNNGRRSDVFDPADHPNAPGAPRTLGNSSVAAVPPASGAQLPPAQMNNQVTDEQPVGAPGGRAAGAPLDISTMGNAPAASGPAVSNALPPPPPRNVSATGAQLATLPPSATPQDEYDMAYGYVLHKDYALAEQAFRDFIGKYPNDNHTADAQYWLGESMFQRQRYREAAESFLAVSTKHEKAGKAPEALLRLGQSLAAMNQKEAACATLAEVGRKYPRASGSVKRSVTQEQKRAHC